MPKFEKRALASNEDAPDPVDFARQAAGQTEAPPDVGDPTVPQDVSMPQALAMIAEALKTIKAGDAGASDRLANIERFLLHQEETRPHENLFNPPMVSALNPLGERDHPRPELQCRIIWVGYELTKDILSFDEIALLNRMEPGSYRVTKADLKRIVFNVQEKRDDAGRREMLTFHFPCKGSEDRQNHAPMVSYLREALGENIGTETLHAQIAALRAQLTSETKAVAVGV